MKQVYSFRLISPKTKEVTGTAQFSSIESASFFWLSINDTAKNYWESSTNFKKDYEEFRKK